MELLKIYLWVYDQFSHLVFLVVRRRDKFQWGP